jgi:hypothetical protein
VCSSDLNRVQFATFLRQGGGTEPHWIDLYLQNCGSAPRTVGFQLSGSLLRKVKVPQPASVEVGPLEVWRLSLPVVTGDKDGTTSVELLIPVRGKGGRRLRLRRAWTSQARSMSPIGEVRLLLPPLPAEQWEADFLPWRAEKLWQPRPGEPDLRP